MDIVFQIIGVGYVVFAILGACGLADFHVYFGPEGGAKAWHQKHAEE